MKNPSGKKKFWKIFVIVVIVLVVGVLAAGLILPVYGQHQMTKIKGMSFEDTLRYTTKGQDRAVITVGVIKNGNSSYTVYGENGKELPKQQHTYEIGSLTKTFTAALLQKAINEKKVDLDAGIDAYLQLPEGKAYPTIRDVVTHTSGYQTWYYESPMMGNFFAGRNEFCGITDQMVLNRAGKQNLKPGKKGWQYSNFGYALLGMVLETVYDTEYTDLVNAFAQNELNLKHTMISDGKGDLKNYWDWKPQDAYLAAGGMTSQIEDMLAYGKLQLEDDGIFKTCHESLREVNAGSARYQMQDIYVDEMGMAWVIDNKNGFIWHNGATGDYNCYLGFCPETNTCVVVLSNLSPNVGAPATVLGIKALQQLQKTN